MLNLEQRIALTIGNLILQAEKIGFTLDEKTKELEDLKKQEEKKSE